MTSAKPLDDFRNLLAALPMADKTAEARVRMLFSKADKPRNSLGRIEDIAAWLAAWSGRAPPAVTRPLVAVFAGNHGALRHGISPRPVAATANAVELCAAGGAAVNQVCIANDLGLKVFDLALHIPTADITEDAALDERGCAATMAFGMEAIAGGADLLCLGDLGVGNSTIAAALFAALYGGKGTDWVGAGSGADAAMQARKAEVVDVALAFHGAHLDDPLEVLRRVGGREFAAIAGAILAARMQKIPVLLDGFAATAAAAVVHAANPAALDHCLLAGLSAEPAHARAAERLGLRPLLDLGVSHGEGVGAALAAGMVKAAALTSSGMAAAVRG
ncbi:nicotinate-nucleotide--dimethylbenzimidazole phosphoribosyltransferase [Mesorhizobium sp. BR1-1-9]|uniref:nicotinate-nucleotide--dimethylbenzimidazole phosphoribosyltransferase n=1 Tax=unclassified Mesorhizobium TaxID=325217 RepID=UPI0011290E59|nr:MULTISPECIES: nicotinate-nucleotide--dimethylbenzimidazole phosphoribosyltransferase [unclassified Mesorhizobium]MBZ9810684.1 nicotinate-nucleotide--dimethylbenzimidazole phosphoribosyltransferase [Mesorhizobium sp. ESP-6-2]MBZ9871207.1 nicotinate-nucleotide--dimethylbenzimidazole phosphoribosyltransferase [Mesorhizobium sp. BR1-1-9]MBZ9943741.1 nicotinate-nucleotide--dimethylbenzimidazole phosphoribosyltransferase [Mesorhizobium sp. BR1-1-13]TPM33939.1 nicotinate-nucleotide--dimethylbenzimi